MTGVFMSREEEVQAIGADEITEFQGVLARFKRLKEYQPGQSWIALIYGPSKSGKTELAGTAGNRSLILNLGEGLETLKSPGFLSRHPDCDDPIIVDIREGDKKATGFDEVGATIDLALKEMSDKFDWVIVDEATALRKLALNRGMELNTEVSTRVREARTQKFVTPEVGDYGKEMQLVEWFLATYIPKLKAAKKHFILLAHERQTFSAPPKIGAEPVLKRITPGFTGQKFPDQIPAYFDDVFRMEVVGRDNSKSYRLSTAGSEMETAGTRHGGVFPTVIQNPNLQEMLAQIRAGKLYAGKK